MELIERDNVIAYLNAQIEKAQQGWLHDYGFPTSVIASLTDAKNLVKNLPTIEAEPIRHGRWETWGFVFRGIEWKRCSECYKAAGVSYYGLLDGKTEMETPAVCGCCGARMDGGAENG